MAIPAQVFEKIPERFDPVSAGDMDATYQFMLSGDDGGNWWVKVVDGTCTVGEGIAADITTTIAMHSTDYVALALGQLDAMFAFMQGKIKVSGDYMALLKLKSLFDKL